MPVYQRRIEPSYVGRNFKSVKRNLVDSLEELANLNLSNFIRQLGDLGQHATEIFNELETAAQVIKDRAQDLSNRTQKVEERINVSDFKLCFGVQ